MTHFDLQREHVTETSEGTESKEKRSKRRYKKSKEHKSPSYITCWVWILENNNKERRGAREVHMKGREHTQGDLQR